MIKMNLRKRIPLDSDGGYLYVPTNCASVQNVHSTLLSMVAFREGTYTRVSISNTCFSPTIDILHMPVTLKDLNQLEIFWPIVHCFF